MNNEQNTTNTQLAEIVNFFNKATMFEPVTELNEYEIRSLAISINQYGVDVIKKAFAKANNSRFLTGNKGYEWKANFGWLIVPEHITKILNGDYDDYKRKPKL